ncbi:myotubularin related protein 1 [Cryptosporidium ryanae]|uniref:myotubularin related protein 1 n=1 Tax=Cryptosporidium ryanae TaxID=515981 RepID=UPI00351AA627|nr:myotubularin related protein 1 [Cryptosporidium ryanae]
MNLDVNNRDLDINITQNECDISEARGNVGSKVNLKVIESGNDPLSIYKTSSGSANTLSDNLVVYEESEIRASNTHKIEYNCDLVAENTQSIRKNECSSKSLEDLSLFESFDSNFNLNKDLGLTNISDKVASCGLNSGLNVSDSVRNTTNTIINSNSNAGRVSGLFSSLASTVTQNISSQIQNALRETTTNMINNGNLKSSNKNKSNSELLKWSDVLAIINKNRNTHLNMNIKKNSDSIEILGINKSESESISKTMNLALYPGETIKMFYKECGISTKYGLPNPIYGSFLITNYRIILAPLYEKGENNRFFNILRRQSLMWMYKSGFFYIPINSISKYSLNSINGINVIANFFYSSSNSLDNAEDRTEDAKKDEIDVVVGPGQGFSSKKGNVNNYYSSFPCLLEVSTRDLRDVQILIVQSDKEKRFLENYMNKIINETISDNFFCYAAYRGKNGVEKLFEFDVVSEYKRMGLDLENKELNRNNGNLSCFPLRISRVNFNYELCNSYPEILIVPRDISDNQLIAVSSFRSKNRIPVLSWTNPNLKCTLWRSSQPKSAFKRCFEDELLITTISKYYYANNSKDKNFTIYDARPKLNAYANKATGAGFENIDNYPYCKLEFLNIENIHKVRDSWNKMVLVVQKISNYNSYCSCKSDNKHFLNEYILELNNKKDEYNDTDISYHISLLDKVTFNENNSIVGIKLYSDIDSTGWYDLISMILISSNKIVNQLINSKGVLVHCSDGWDRTSQLTALSMICIDPYYRTIKGFITLIEKEFVTVGHKFHSRYGTLGLNPPSDSESERSPIFFQWLDCIYQCIVQFPNEFQFNQNLLLFIAEQINNSLFGNFICDNDCERNSINSKNLTLSLWDTILKHSNEFYTNYSNGYNDKLSSNISVSNDYSPPIGINSNIFYHSGFVNINYKYNSILSLNDGNNNKQEYFNEKLINRDNILILDPTSIKIKPWLQFWFKFSPLCLRTI